MRLEQLISPEILSLLIPIIAIVLGIGVGFFTLYLNYRNRKDMFAQYHQERMAAIEKGIELPPLPEEFFAEDGKPQRPRSPHRRLLTGLIFLFLGLACFITGYMVDDPNIAKFTKYGFFPLGLGLAYLIYYFAVGRKEAEAIEAERKAKAAEASRASLP
jgi:hypothetical protein